MKINYYKIAFVANTAWSIYNFRKGIIQELLQQHNEVIIIAPKDNYSSLLEDLGCVVYNISMDNNGINPLKDLKTILNYFITYYQVKIDLIFNYTIKPIVYGTLAGALHGIPTISVITGLGNFLTRKPAIQFIAINLYKLAGWLNKEMWFLNKDDLNIFLERQVVDKKNTYILNSEGVNTTYFSPRKIEKDTQKTIFLFAGRIIKDKGLEILVNAIKKLQQNRTDFEVHILGFIKTSNPNTIPFHKIKTWEKAGIIKYFGNTIDIRPYIAKSDCIILPSFYREGIPRFLLEGASMERPIITTNHVGCKEVVTHNVTGLLCEPKDVSSLADRMNKFLNMDDQQRRKLGIAGRKKIVQKFDESLIIKEYLRKIKSVLANDSKNLSSNR